MHFVRRQALQLLVALGRRKPAKRAPHRRIVRAERRLIGEQRLEGGLQLRREVHRDRDHAIRPAGVGVGLLEALDRRAHGTRCIAPRNRIDERVGLRCDLHPVLDTAFGDRCGWNDGASLVRRHQVEHQALVCGLPATAVVHAALLDECTALHVDIDSERCSDREEPRARHGLRRNRRRRLDLDREPRRGCVRRVGHDRGIVSNVDPVLEAQLGHQPARNRCDKVVPRSHQIQRVGLGPGTTQVQETALESHRLRGDHEDDEWLSKA